MQTVRLTSILPFADGGALPSAALAFFTSVSCEAARPTPTPRPERRRKARRSMVGSALRQAALQAVDERRARVAAPGRHPTFLVSNMELSVTDWELDEAWSV